MMHGMYLSFDIFLPQFFRSSKNTLFVFKGNALLVLCHGLEMLFFSLNSLLLQFFFLSNSWNYNVFACW